MKKGGFNRPAQFGAVATEAEREAASEVLDDNLRARELGDWSAQCASLSASAINALEKSVGKKAGVGKGCTENLRAAAEPLKATKAVRANSLTGPIDVLRVKGPEAFALYHGAKGKDYAMPMKMEDGEWKVAGLLTLEVP